MSEYKGICSNCMHASNCSYRKNSDRYIYYCEEFEVAPKKSESSSVKMSKQQSEDKQKEDSTLKGLCVNCENRYTCKIPKLEGGIWHCEEYR